MAKYSVTGWAGSKGITIIKEEYRDMKNLYCIDEDGYLDLPEALLREVGIFPEDQVELFINENGELVIQKVTDDMMDDVSPESWVLVTPLPMIHPELIRD
ncbi:MAG TPA: hypothetical protein DDY49_00215 [Paenibacillaceae bacterium]|nr:hypothetical protein [Paenibacillaceae bacterium]